MAWRIVHQAGTSNLHESSYTALELIDRWLVHLTDVSLFCSRMAITISFQTSAVESKAAKAPNFRNSAKKTCRFLYSKRLLHQNNSLDLQISKTNNCIEKRTAQSRTLSICATATSPHRVVIKVLPRSKPYKIWLWGEVFGTSKCTLAVLVICCTEVRAQ